MRFLIILLLVSCLSVSISRQQNITDTGPVESGILEPCDENKDLSREYQFALYDFTMTFYKAIAVRGDLNFVYSPLSMWLILAAVAEGAEPNTQKQLFQFLHLPNNLCIRQKYYQMATSCLVPSDDVNIVSKSFWLIDEGVTVNSTWYEFVKKHSLLELLRAAIRFNTGVAALEMSQLMSVPLPRLNLNGNSVLLDSLDYNGLWTTAFPDAGIERALFYNQQGYPVGTVDLMIVKRRARMGYVKSISAKFLELPVGLNARYRMFFLVFLETGDLKTRLGGFPHDIVTESLNSLQEAAVPLEIAIPRMVLTSVIDMKTVLEDLGVTSLWNDPAATR